MFNFIFGLLTGSIIGIFIQCVVKPKPLALAMGISDTSIEFTQVIEDGQMVSTMSSAPLEAVKQYIENHKSLQRQKGK